MSRLRAPSIAVAPGLTSLRASSTRNALRRGGAWLATGVIVLLHAVVLAQPPQRGTPPPAAPGQPPGGRGGGRGGVQTMTLTSTAWSDGGQIPAKYSQAGDQVSPPLAWSHAPESVASFVL